ncbi:MAG: hypothetical protein IPO27_12105 [Bacteroidetes bacterium]|nr:hypothetical protein [Bacteroidota bacterium]
MNCKSQNLYTKIYESNGEFYVWSLAELKDSSIILHTKQVGAAETGLYHINVYGDTISKFNAWPPILGA